LPIFLKSSKPAKVKKSKMKKIKIGLAGLGIVGKGVYEILKKDAKILTKRTGIEFEIIAASARSKKDFLDEKIRFYENAVDLANDPEIDVIVEVIGGEVIAKNLIESALKKGKKFVTANKALLANHGFELAELAEKNNSTIGFEASVAGANPIIKIFKEGLAANEIKEFYAILNGTCNFILTKMQNENLDFAVALKEAQNLGYAESDPAFDIKGIDTAHKLSILAAIASGTKPAFKQLHVEGIDEISIDDINLAKELGYKIKLLGVYKKQNGKQFQAVYPALISATEKIAQVDEAYNAILAQASNAGFNLSIGSGAGSLPTASSIVADLVDVATNRNSFTFGIKASELEQPRLESLSERVGRYFLKLLINKNQAQKTNLAQAVFGIKIKIENVVFIDRNEEILCGFLTETLAEKDITEILKNLDSKLVKAAKFLRVEETQF
jgi:homoserine dehydrogenase